MKLAPLTWLRERDRDLAALRRAGRTAIAMPSAFAIGDKVIGDPTIATFAALGSFAMLLLVDFGGPMRVRLQDQAALALVSGGLVCLGTLASRTAWLAALAMALVAFAVLFASVVSSVLAAAATPLMLSFILPVSLRAPVSAIPDRLAGWAIAAGGACIAVRLLWPGPVRDQLRALVADACLALAEQLRSHVAFSWAVNSPAASSQYQQAATRARGAVDSLRARFYATPYRPTGLSTGSRVLVRTVDEMDWLEAIVAVSGREPVTGPARKAVCEVKLASASALELGAEMLSHPGRSTDRTSGVLESLRRLLGELERSVIDDLPGAEAKAESSALGGSTSALVSSLDPGFRSQELSFAVSQIVGNIELAVAADQRGWLARLAGRQPAGLTSTFAAAQERAASHLERHSVTLHNAIRGAIALGLAVLVADLTGVQHSFWVVLGTLSVLRSNALNTGQNVLRGLAGTVAGVVVGAVVLALIGTNTVLLWLVLPVSILFAGIAPAAISFAAGQAAFTVVLVVLFNIIQPLGWRVGIIRVEDVALGCAVSLVVGLLFWPRGAASALGQALAEAYTESARYLSSAVGFATGGGGPGLHGGPGPVEEATRAAAASRRLDDTFRGYLAERGAKPVPLSEVTALVTGVVALRLAGDAVLDLWRGQSSEGLEDRAGPSDELTGRAAAIAAWYEALAASLLAGSEVPAPSEREERGEERLVSAVLGGLRSEDPRASARAVRMIWTAGHLDAARRVEGRLVPPARAVAEQKALAPGLVLPIRRRATAALDGRLVSR